MALNSAAARIQSARNPIVTVERSRMRTASSVGEDIFVLVLVSETEFVADLRRTLSFEDAIEGIKM